MLSIYWWMVTTALFAMFGPLFLTFAMLQHVTIR
jgi:hypothetical protein